MPRLCLTEDLETAELPDEGPLRHVLRRSGRRDACLRLGEVPAGMILSLDGDRELEVVLADAEADHGRDGPALLVRLLAELGDRGFLRDVGDGGEDPTGGPGVRTGAVTGLLGPRRWRWRRAPAMIDAIYRAGGRRLVTGPALGGYVTVAVVGLIAFALLLARGGVTPFLVGGGLGLGVICFIGGRMALVVVHELAHGLMLQRFGRRVDGAGITLVAIFPYAYVDTSSAWLEPRRHRMAVSAAGPLSDLTLGGATAVASLLCHGVAAEIGFQLALAGYLAALLNLNPCLDRDGYYLLADALRLPGLRSAGLRSLAQSLSGGDVAGNRRLRWYGLAVVLWSIAGSGLVISSLWGTLATLRAMIPHDVSLVLMLALWMLLLVPTGLLVGRPLAERARGARRRAVTLPGPTVTTAGAQDAVARLGSAGAAAAAVGLSQAPIVRLARQVLTDASLRERIRNLGAPPGFEILGQRELRSSVAGVVLAAGSESLGLTHVIDVATPAAGHLVSHIADHTSLDQLRTLLGMNHTVTPTPVHLAPSYVPHDASQPEPLLYEPPRGPAGGAANAGGPEITDVGGGADDNAFGIGLDLPAWPGNDAGPVAIAHWMAAGARSAGLPGQLPVMAALVESNLDNNACCNADSLGYFQMRESVWNYGPWAGYDQNPELQLSWFIQEAVTVRSEMVAAGYTSFGESSSDWGNWIADVENPAFEYRYRYQLQLGEATALLAESAG